MDSDYAAIGFFLIGLLAGPILTAIACTQMGWFGLIVPAGAVVSALIPGFRALGAGVLIGSGAALLLFVSICGGVRI